jgi:hypothetical protein
MSISETVSENSSAVRGPGRPKAWHADDVLDAFSLSKTKRGKENFRLATSAFGTLQRNWKPSYGWFWHSPPLDFSDLDLGVMSGSLKWRATVLTEIGRFQNEDDRIAVADVISTLPASTTSRDAVERCRRLRLDHRKPATVDGLTSHLAAALNAYLASHTDTTLLQIQEAISNVDYAAVHAFETRVSETVSETEAG